jgi:NAD(P)-dependent dehydrogenase (short-subunit alcohol dehydrogenase family)
MMDVNVRAAFHTFRSVIPHMRRARNGRIVAIASRAAVVTDPGIAAYAASKAALETLVRVWANETASLPLRVNLFSPGPIRTRMRATVFPGEDPMTLDTPDQAAEFIVPMCTPEWTETGKLYDSKARKLMSFQPPV